jgi:hypothetical protein
MLLLPASQVHADDRMVQQQRISFKRPDGSAGSITLAQPHLMYRLTSDVGVGATAADVTQCKSAGS